MLVARDVTKEYRERRAERSPCCATCRSRSRRAPSSRSSDRPAAARRRCSACSPDSIRRRAAQVLLDDADLTRDERGRARAASRRESRLRLPELSADLHAHRARERPGAARAARRTAAPASARASCSSASGSADAARPLPDPALGRRAAARRDRARVRQLAAHPLRRRADGQSRQRHGRANRRAARGAQPRIEDRRSFSSRTTPRSPSRASAHHSAERRRVVSTTPTARAAA